MILEPLHDNVFIERDKSEERKTPGKLVLPKSAQKAPDTAVVIAVGPGRVLDDGTIVKPTVKVGDRILVGRHSGVDVNWEMDRRTVVPWGDILGIVRDEIKKDIDKL